VFVFLITLGGLGFLVLTELKTLITAKTSLKDLSLHTKMVLIFSLVLILFGFNHFFFIEKLTFIQSLFLSVTARTAGFNTVATEMLKGNSLFVLIVLMFVGASPGGTGGGIKTTTMFTIFLIIWANLRNSENINFMGRSITKYAVRKSISIFFVSALLLFLGVIAISDLEKINFLAVLFEAASALGTVGLSTGITAGFSSATKVILILLMILGRVGPVAFGAALFNLGESKIPTKYSSEKIMLG
jgi:trk system potassium uptake protein TrkH